MTFVSRENSRDEPIVTQELHAYAIELIVTAFYCNPGLTFGFLVKSDQIGNFFSHWFKKLSSFSRVHDKKIGILAITNILTAIPNQLLGLPGLSEQLLRAAITLFEELPKAIVGKWNLSEASKIAKYR